MRKPALMLLSLIGLFDSFYLSYKHFKNIIPPCTGNIFSDCGQVLTSEYAYFFGIPLAYIGIIYYAILTVSLVTYLKTKDHRPIYLFILANSVGIFFSVYFVFLQLVVIKAICTYCMLSALVTFSIFGLWQKLFNLEKNNLVIASSSIIYQNFIKRIFFLLNPEIIHDVMVLSGAVFGRIRVVRFLFRYLFLIRHKSLHQEIFGINFKNPVGLAAGFDYNGNLWRILPCIGFGFQAVGTVSNHPFKGYNRIMLGRLPKSKSLYVNKGFKNIGSEKIIKKLEGSSIAYPLGISIGQTNDKKFVSGLEEAIEDIYHCFSSFQNSKVDFTHFELNISCPNLENSVDFYTPVRFIKLADKLKELKLTKPVFIKMPINLTANQLVSLLDIAKEYYFIKGVVIGNLQKNRKNKSFDREELKRFAGEPGSFSGLPTQKDSNDLIKTCFHRYKARFVIIGCGGVFGAIDAYKKIKLGATLVQFITGMIYNGPQFAAEVNNGLTELLKKDGYSHISEAIGVEA
ncbi:dihydroorotate dehydrogenase (quinone) [Candidatus Roizmanbacteria bacterium RIFCSPLOWO2_02_FULL_38_10]|uniref:Dihydroorotate dehydrogenase (quinone) n=1 Tax=Candidatus Roizmanbacteria bacterium RIFCSPLOWO2_02_FULL_38_10 TaxID=1802074 RepID=A0A1F7JKN9_9BACT|nr:MAG: dihydroorotate dehydrogenase (quinone) [Candidatus Roizmanbacteria bacterium RIFCSPLOWO2_02_FULL_38_10]